MTAISTFATNATMSSREIAALTGKEHRSVLRDCDNLNENYERMGLHKIVQGYYTHPNTGSQRHRELLLNRMQTMDLMTGYNIELRIKVNRRWEELERTQTAAIDFSNPDTVLKLAQNWAEEVKKREAVEEKLKIAAPKALFADAVAQSSSSILVGALAKILNQKGIDIGQNRLFEWMRCKGYMCSVGKNNNVPTQKAMNMGLFEISETAVSRTEGVFTRITPYVTGKGQIYFINKFLSQNNKLK
jgi:anti-repressor protein